MKTARRVAALLSTTALAAGGVTALTATPASAAATCSAAKPTSAIGATLSHSVCRDGTTTTVRGTLRDPLEDGCYARVRITLARSGADFKETYETGSSLKFEMQAKNVTSIDIDLDRRC
ncbi:hypothetical protein DF268_03795 [Streptomyces sp. V2]|uniref:Secreted protein n=1 Tax=Streptomyces niveiscabiei TaxID=164115 RepID=A0ABW9HSH0_9ACTN|nr:MULTISPECIES: hypothetical protein [Streptomyces]PWG14866.1 hypothetical protein DF268_03795 [Streptomyces sp. V2]QZZ31755.1 hypothetical protein A7X85_41025 [Streptomyces sp. ST1015]